jgi:hypothetical protein
MSAQDPAAASGADDETMTALHTLALRGSAPELPGDTAALVERGLVIETRAGWMLTADGHARHDERLAAERETLDRDALTPIYERFLAANTPLKSLSSTWQTADEDARFELLGQLADIVDRVEPALRRTTAILPRFAGYHPRLADALARAEDGDLDYVVSPRVESVHTVWMECHEDYLQTLGISREEEGSY